MTIESRTSRSRVSGFQARHAGAADAPQLPGRAGADASTRPGLPRLLARRRERRVQRVLRFRRRTVTLLAAGFGVLSGAGVAVAYWTVSGQGTASATVVGPQVTASAGSVTGLYPGGPAGTLQVAVTNGGAAPYAVTGVAPGSAGLPAGCPGSAFVISPPTALPTVAPSSTATIPVAVSMPSDAPNACQAATAGVPLHVTGTLR